KGHEIVNINRDSPFFRLRSAPPMRNFAILLFIAALPPLTALGHDLYLAFDMDNMTLKDTGLRFTALGKFWVDYSRDTYVWVRETEDSDTRKNVIDPLLYKPAPLLTLVFPVIVLVLQALFMLIGEERFIRQRLIRRGRPP